MSGAEVKRRHQQASDRVNNVDVGGDRKRVHQAVAVALPPEGSLVRDLDAH